MNNIQDPRQAGKRFCVQTGSRTLGLKRYSSLTLGYLKQPYFGHFIFDLNVLPVDKRKHLSLRAPCFARFSNRKLWMFIQYCFLVRSNPKGSFVSRQAHWVELPDRFKGEQSYVSTMHLIMTCDINTSRCVYRPCNKIWHKSQQVYLNTGRCVSTVLPTHKQRVAHFCAPTWLLTGGQNKGASDMLLVVGHLVITCFDPL